MIEQIICVDKHIVTCVGIIHIDTLICAAEIKIWNTKLNNGFDYKSLC